MTLAALALVTVASMAPASAGEGGGTEAAVESDVGPLAQAPTCVRATERQSGLSKYTDVLNLCGRSYRVKVIIAFGFDSACVHLDEGDGFTHSYGIAGRLDRVDLC